MNTPEADLADLSSESAPRANAIFTDGVHLVLDAVQWKRCAGLFSEGYTIEWEAFGQLHLFAARIGLRRAWFQRRASTPHYDLTTAAAAERAIRAGAALVSVRDVARLCKLPGEAFRPEWWKPRHLGEGLEERAALARTANRRLMRRFR